MFAYSINCTSERNPGDTQTIKGRTYSLNCNGLVGDMLFFTDLDYTELEGHNIAEVEIYGTGKMRFLPWSSSFLSLPPVSLAFRGGLSNLSFLSILLHNILLLKMLPGKRTITDLITQYPIAIPYWLPASKGNLGWGSGGRISDNDLINSSP